MNCVRSQILGDWQGIEYEVAKFNLPLAHSELALPCGAIMPNGIGTLFTLSTYSRRRALNFY